MKNEEVFSRHLRLVYLMPFSSTWRHFAACFICKSKRLYFGGFSKLKHRFLAIQATLKIWFDSLTKLSLIFQAISEKLRLQLSYYGNFESRIFQLKLYFGNFENLIFGLYGSFWKLPNDSGFFIKHMCWFDSDVSVLYPYQIIFFDYSPTNVETQNVKPEIWWMT